MESADRLDTTLLAVMEECDLNLLEAKNVADALKLPTLESIRTTRIRDLDCNQIRALAVALKRRADWILGI